MSNQPPEDQNFERHIPGLRQAVSRLSSIASASGYRIATIVITQDRAREGAGVPPTRITFASPPQESAPPMAATTQPPENWMPDPTRPHQWRRGEALPPLGQMQAHEQYTSDQPATATRSKRASTSVIGEGDDGSPPVGKRKRFSDPSAPTAGPSGAFWGTVLEERPGAPRGMMPSQVEQPQPAQTAPLPATTGVTSTAGLRGPRAPPEEIQPSAQRDQEGRVHRSSTFPALRMRAPLGQRQRQQLLPSLPDPSVIAPVAVYPDRQPSPEILPVSQPQPERRFLRRAAGQILGRLSPFGAAGPSLSRTPPSPSPLKVEAQIFGQAPQATSGLPALFGTPQRTAPEVFSHPSRDRYYETQPLPPLQGIPTPSPPGTQFGQHSGSRSASGSGVSHARPSHSASPPTVSVGEGSRTPRTDVAARGKRGRKAGTTPDREQFFECEQCNSKFRRKSDKNRHVRVVHEKSRPFVCPMCEKTFGEKSNMLKHRASVHDDVRTFRCPYCDATFSQRGLCDTHVRSVHDKKQAKYFCEHCGLPFSRKVQLNEHYEQVHPEYMSAQGRYHGAQTGAPATVTASTRGARREGGEMPPSMQGGYRITTPQGSPTATLPAFRGTDPVETVPPRPQQWMQYPRASQPLSRGDVEQSQERSSRQRSFQGDSSGGNGS